MNADNMEVTNTEIKSDIQVERRGSAGLITLNRPKALNALSLQMVRDLTATLLAFRDDPEVLLVAIRGTNKVGKPGSAESRFGGFCAGGDIRFFHQAATSGDDSASAELEAFFTEEYSLNHLIQTYSKPYIAFMDGVVMGGGMGLSQGARVRIVTEHTKMAMPETNIGLFPDVGGGYFLSRCPGHVGEYLALTGEVIGADEAIAFGLADIKRETAQLPVIWDQMGSQNFESAAAVNNWISTELAASSIHTACTTTRIDAYFSLLRVKHMVDALEKAKDDPWAGKMAAVLRKRSPLMLHVTLEQIRRARNMTLADDLRMERDMVHQCFHLRPGTSSETVEGIRALAVDKDYKPQWSPARIEDVKPGMADAFFASPWTPETHPLRSLG
ncbi:MAG: enoyl-CoA hydratase/isomerase family protein [Pseudomonadota bacterium]